MEKVASFKYLGTNIAIIKAESKDDFEEYDTESSTFMLKFYDGEDIIFNYNGELPALFWCRDDGDAGYRVFYFTKDGLLDRLSKRKDELLKELEKEVRDIDEAKTKIMSLAKF